MHDNQYYTPNGSATACGHSPPQEPGVKVAAIPDDATIIGWAKDMLAPSS
jgi:hypothetical protein